MNTKINYLHKHIAKSECNFGNFFKSPFLQNKKKDFKNGIESLIFGHEWIHINQYAENECKLNAEFAIDMLPTKYPLISQLFFINFGMAKTIIIKSLSV